MSTAAPREMLWWKKCRHRMRTRCTAGEMPAASTAARAMRIRMSRTAHSSARPTITAATTSALRPKSCSSRRSTEILSNRGLNLPPRHRSQHPPALHAVLEQHEQRDAARVELRGQARVVVDVELAEADVAALGGELLDDRRDHAARPAPRRPEVDHPRTSGDHPIEVAVVERGHAAAGRKRRLASTAYGAFPAGQGRHAIHLPAVRAAHFHTLCYCK